MKTQEIKEQSWDKGYTKIRVFSGHENEQPLTLRLFMRGDDLCFFKPNSNRRGYRIATIAQNISRISVVENSKQLSNKDAFLDAQRKLKKAFTSRLHPNLHADYRKGYEALDLDAFEQFANGRLEDGATMYDAMQEFKRATGIDDIFNIGTIKTVNLTSVAPVRSRWFGGMEQYRACIANIKQHIDNRESFRYRWDSNYDVSVCGYTNQAGEYRVELALEFRGCGNGHYYVMINDKTAVWTEDD